MVTRLLPTCSPLLFALILFACCFVPADAQNVRATIPFPSITSQYTTPFLVANVAPNLPVIAVCNYPANASSVHQLRDDLHISGRSLPQWSAGHARSAALRLPVDRRCARQSRLLGRAGKIRLHRLHPEHDQLLRALRDHALALRHQRHLHHDFGPVRGHHLRDRLRDDAELHRDLDWDRNAHRIPQLAANVFRPASEIERQFRHRGGRLEVSGQPELISR